MAFFLCGARQHHQAPSSSLYSYSCPSLSTTTNSSTIAPAPVYITIGPPCCGKTEALRSHLLEKGYNPDVVFSSDVALHHQPSVYHRIPLAGFLFPTTHLNSSVAAQLLSSGCSVLERLCDPSHEKTDSELRHVIMRLAGRMTPQEFQDRVLQQAKQAGDSIPFFQKRRRAIAHDLHRAVEHVAAQAVAQVICQLQFLQQEEAHHDDDDEELPYQEQDDKDQKSFKDITNIMNATQAHLLSARQLLKTPHVDLFVPQAIFHGGIHHAEVEFQQKLLEQPLLPISWGNTNTRPTEYVAALSAAQSANRPVEFLAWGTPRLPRTTRCFLLQTNVARFRNTGRYIPAGAIGAALGRVESLIKEAERQVENLFDNETRPCNFSREEEWTCYKMNVALAHLAGFRMDRKGFVEQVGEPKRLRPKVARSKQQTSKRGALDCSKG